MAATPRSVSSVAPVGTVAAGSTVTIPAPSGLAVGDYYVIFFAPLTQSGANTVATPSGFTSLTPTGGSSSTRIMAAFGRTIPDTTVRDAILANGTPVVVPAAGATRVVAFGVAMTGVPSAPVAAETALTWGAAASTSAALTQPSAGDVWLHFVASNSSSTSTHPNHTPNAGTKLAQVTAYATGTSPTGDPQADTVGSLHLGASSVAFSSSVANNGSFGIGFTSAAAVQPSTVTLTPVVLTVSPVPLTPTTPPAPSTVNLTPAVLTLAPVQLTPSVGTVVVTLTPAVLTVAPVPVTPTPGRVTMALTPAVLTLAPVPLSPASPATISAWLSTGTFYAAHRGGGDNYSEHTMAAYDNAYAKGMKALEVSTQRTSDGVWVCFHDTTTTRMTGVNLTIASSTWAQLQALTVAATYQDDRDNVVRPTTDTSIRQPIALLTDVLAKYLGKIVLLIESKAGADAGALLTLLDTYGTPTSSVIWKQAGVSNAGTSSARSKGYFVWSYFTADNDLDATLVSYAAKGDMLGVNYLDSDADVSRIVAYGKAQTPPKRTMMWAIHDQATRDHARALGVDGFMTSNLNAVSTVPENTASPSSVTLTPAVLTVAPVPVTPTPGAVTVQLTPAVLTLTPVAVAPQPGPVALALTPAVLTLAPVPVAPVAGTVTVQLTPAVVTLAPVPVTPTPGRVSVQLTPTVLTLVAVQLVPTGGAVTVQLTPATLTLAPVALAPQPGTAALTLTPLTLTLTPVALAPQPGRLLLTLTPATLTVQAQPLHPNVTGATDHTFIARSRPRRWTGTMPPIGPIPHQTAEWYPLDVLVDGTLVLEGVEVCVLPFGVEPDDTSWAAARVLSGSTCVRIEGLTRGWWVPWSKTTRDDETSVLAYDPIRLD